VTLAASAGGTTKTYSLSLNGGIPKLTLSTVSLNFGSVNLSSLLSLSVTLTSSGTAPVTVSTGSVTGTGFTLSGVAFPLTLNVGQSAVLTISFNPLAALTANGLLTLTSNSSTGVTSTVTLSGTGLTVAYQVNLSWDAPASSSDPAVGYNVYRASSGSSSYSLMNSSLDAATSYTDTTVADGTSYTYYVVSVDSAGNQSSPSSAFTATIP
jgi:Abnormal spindle-like microcephaly-assoc'd, ASPM-SPD-2-Hydin